MRDALNTRYIHKKTIALMEDQRDGKKESSNEAYLIVIEFSALL